MIEEAGRVVAVDGRKVWIETLQQTSCGSCSAKSTCGQGLMNQMGKPHHICLTAEQELHVGDQVLLGIPENTLLQSAMLAYGLPLMLFVLLAALADSLLNASEPIVILAGLLGLCVGFIAVRRIASGRRGAHMQPIILSSKAAPIAAQE